MWKIFKNQKLRKAVTLIELIIIVTIILIFVFIIYTQIEQKSAARTRDIKRISELNSLRTALKLYFMDKGEYPEQITWCSIEGNCNNLVAELESYINRIPGDPLYPKEEEELIKKYSYQYRTITFNQEYKIHADLEGHPHFYEVYSGSGLVIDYAPERTGPGTPPTLLVYTAIWQYGDIYKLRGEVVNSGVAYGVSGGILERGFDWRLNQTEYGPGNQWTEATGSEGFPPGYFDRIQDGFIVPPEYSPGCVEYCYRAKAKDIEGDWGYSTDPGEEPGGECSTGERSFTVCDYPPPFAFFFEPVIYEGTETPLFPPESIPIYVKLYPAVEDEEVTVRFRRIGGTATPPGQPGPDYDISVPDFLRFSPGVTSATFTVTIIDDPFIEGDETVIFEIYEPSSGIEISDLSTSSLTIHDDDGGH